MGPETTALSQSPKVRPKTSERDLRRQLQQVYVPGKAQRLMNGRIFESETEQLPHNFEDYEITEIQIDHKMWLLKSSAVISSQQETER